MLNEGGHVAGISGVILFRPTVSPIIYKQQIGRALTAGDSATPLILDVVNNFEGLSSISGLQDEMTAAVQRLYANGEGDKVEAYTRAGDFKCRGPQVFGEVTSTDAWKTVTFTADT